MNYGSLRRRVGRVEEITHAPHRDLVAVLTRIARHTAEDPARGIERVSDDDLEVVAGCTEAEYDSAVREVGQMTRKGEA